MARKPRIEYEGALYHVITRGNQKQKIFKESLDYRKFLDNISAYKQRYHFRIYAYVLMTNHVHLLIETQEVPLSKILQGINQSYTMYYNHKYKTVGHLFQGRYKAILCDRDRYLLTLLKYIHYNPLRAQIVETLDNYPWSSYKVYFTEENRSDIIDTKQVLALFSENKVIAQKQYKAFMNDGVPVEKDDIYATIDHRVLGDDQFIENTALKYGGFIKKERRKKEFTLSKIGRTLEKRYHVSLEDMQSWRRTSQILTVRRLFSLIAKEYGYTGREIAAYLQKDPAAVTAYLRAGEAVEKELEAAVKALTRDA
ncbi:MAG: transposase [Deltaproteobacteria bacterium]|nr:transposase [Deltaproteobacteria bacterium]